MSSGARLTRQPRGTFIIATVLFAALVPVAPAAAQVTAGSAVATGLTGRGVDAAHDPVNNRFLVVNAPFGPPRGVFVNAAGSPVGSPFAISFTGYSNFVRVAYSADVGGGSGGYLVVWSSEESPSINVRARIVHADGTLGAESVIGTSAWLESAPAVAYSRTSKKFFVVWGGIPTVRGTLVDLNGMASGSVVSLSTTYGRDPGVTWNPARDDFGVSFNGETSTSVYSVLAIVPAANPAGFSRNTFRTVPGGANYITDVDFDTQKNRYVMVSWEGFNARAAEFDASGNLVGEDVASLNFGSYDTLSIGYNPHTGTFLMGGSDPRTDELRVAELDGRVRRGSEITLAGVKAVYTRVAPSRSERRWLTSASGGSGDGWHVRTAPFTGNVVLTAPTPPTLISPAGDVTSAATFTWNAVSVATWYHLWVNDSTGNRVKQWYTAAQAGCDSGSGTCSISPGVSMVNGAGTWWVQSWNTLGASPWSPGMSFTLKAPPGTPTLTAPIGTIYHGTPVFTWNAVPKATSYQLWLDDASGNRLKKWYPASELGCGSGGTCTAAPGLQLASGVGNWWVQAWEPVGGHGAWSSRASFSLQGATLLSATMRTGGLWVDHRWKRVPGATWYMLWVEAGPGNPPFQQWFTADAACGATECTVPSDATVLASGTRFWWVLTYGDTWPGKYGVWSAPGTFVKP